MDILTYNGRDVKPSYGTGIQRDPKLRSVVMGDGYEQVAPNGINHNPIKLNVRFDKRRSAEAEAIVAFLETQGGHLPFIWVPPAPYNNKTRAWRCKTWGHDYNEWDDEVLACVFEEAFGVNIPQVPAYPIIFQLEASSAEISDGLYRATTLGYWDGADNIALGPITNQVAFSPIEDYRFYWKWVYTDDPFSDTFQLDETNGDLLDKDFNDVIETFAQPGIDENYEWAAVYVGAFSDHKRANIVKHIVSLKQSVWNALPLEP